MTIDSPVGTLTDYTFNVDDSMVLPFHDGEIRITVRGGAGGRYTGQSASAGHGGTVRGYYTASNGAAVGLAIGGQGGHQAAGGTAGTSSYGPVRRPRRRVGDRRVLSGGGNQRWILGVTTTGIEAFVYNAGYSGFGATVSLTGGAWHLVGVSRRSGTGASNLYHQGASIGAGTIAAPLGSSTTEAARKAGAANYFDGGMCGVACFPSALTTGQHLTLAQAAGLA